MRQLDLALSNDTLGRWMAHYIAERMQVAKVAPPEAKAVAQDRCAEAILSLWEHRRGLPDGVRPLEGLEPILQTLRRLSSDTSSWRFWPFNTAHLQSKPGSNIEIMTYWLQTAEQVDRAARVLIRYALMQASAGELDIAQAWRSRIDALSSPPPSDVMDNLASFLLNERERENDVVDDSISASQQQRRLEDEITDLLALTRVVSSVLEAKCQALKALPTSSEDDV